MMHTADFLHHRADKKDFTSQQKKRKNYLPNYLYPLMQITSTPFNNGNFSCVAFHLGTSYLFCRTKQMTGFYMKQNTGWNR